MKGQRVKRTKGCWLWTGTCYRGGYGNLKVNGRYTGAHRISYTLFHGHVPKNKQGLHKCDNPKCVNPDHLFLGNPKINAVDRAEKGRGNRPAGEKNGRSILTREDVEFIRTSRLLGRKDLARMFK